MSTSRRGTEQKLDSGQALGAGQTIAEDGLMPRLREIVAAVAEMEPDEVGVDALFYDDLLIDSLQKLEIIVRIERGFGVRLTDEQAANLSSVADAVELLRADGAVR